MPKKKKFISKKNSVTFQVVHRSQQDPLIADETAPQHVLVAKTPSKKDFEEEHKYGIFFDDDYDYLQHLRSADTEVHWDEIPNANQKKRVQLPSSVFASHIEEDVGLLNKAAPVSGLRLDLDPDVVAAMDEDFDFDNPDNVLEDNFIELANAENCENGDDDYEVDAGDEEGFWEDESDDVPEMKEFETKSRFTDYSLSSSVIRRNAQLTLLDDCFEKAFEGYNESEIGGLDTDEIEGTVPLNDDRLIAMAEAAINGNSTLEESSGLKNKILNLLDNDTDDEFDVIVIDQEKEKWDCESILSTYSNIYNHPARIVEPQGPRKIRINKKTGIPMDEIEKNPRLTARNLATLSGYQENNGSAAKSVISQISELSFRPKDETPDQRKERKKNLRVYRHERRAEKKANTIAFTEEKKRQEKAMLNQFKSIKIL